MSKSFNKLVNEIKRYDKKKKPTRKAQLKYKATGSANTSRKQVAGAFKKVSWRSGTYNLDIGGGKFEDATNFLAKKGVTNLVYDPYNRDADHNDMTWELGDQAETTTIFNVLNVIHSARERKGVLIKAKRRKTKRIYITVYEKDRDGVGEPTKDGWQNNMVLADYLPEVQEVYPQAFIKGGIINIKL